jgi:serine/threonine protein kinase
MPTPSAADLVESLSELRILDAAQLDKINRAMKGRSPEPKAVARELLKHGWITAYQANLLLQGRGTELVLGPYVLLERLGEGGMGQVFKARHQIMDRTVAIKVIRKEMLSHPDAVQRFHREIRAAAQLDHPHLVRAHDAAQVGDTHFLVMEYAEGTDLHRLVQKSGPLPVGLACEYARQAAMGLQHAHERGLVHRDVKPSNLQVTAQGTAVKILDMGLARSQTAGGNAGGGLTQSRSMMGTPDFIAPEQIADASRVDVRADIYSLGCTLYFLLAGRPPFPVEAWEEKLVCHKKVEPELIEQVRPDVSPDLGAILRKMMAKRPGERYAAPAAVADALAPFCAMGGLAAGAFQPPTVSSLPTQGSVPATPASLMDGPAAGYERGWTLKADSTVHPPVVAAAETQPVTPFSGPTLLSAALPEPGQPTSTPSTQPGPGVWKRFLLVLAGGGAVLGLLVVLLLIVWPRGGDTHTNADKDKKLASGPLTNEEEPKEQPKPVQPQVFIDEDFRTAFKNKLNIPEGWTEGDAFRIVKLNEEPCLEISTPTGAPFVTLPPVKLSGNFSIEGLYFLDFHNKLTLHLENRKTNVNLLVVIDFTGAVHIGDSPSVPLPGYKPGLPTQFLLTRKGNQLSVALKGEIVATKDLHQAPEFETLRLGMTVVYGQHRCRLFRLKVSTLPTP